MCISHAKCAKPIFYSLVPRPSHCPVFAICMLQVIKNWAVRRPGNEATYFILASFPGPHPASYCLQYDKRREAGEGPGNEANFTLQPTNTEGHFKTCVTLTVD